MVVFILISIVYMASSLFLRYMEDRLINELKEIGEINSDIEGDIKQHTLRIIMYLPIINTILSIIVLYAFARGEFDDNKE